jgi:hypothetical protein
VTGDDERIVPPVAEIILEVLAWYALNRARLRPSLAALLHNLIKEIGLIW